MKTFEYAKPASRAEAVTLLSAKGGGAVALAGGTDLLSLLKDGLVTPTRVVDLKGIPDLRGVEKQADGSLRVGALATLQDLLDSPAAKDFPALLQAAEGVSAPQVRSRGTVGGDLLQWPRCWYFRQGFGLTAARGGRSMAEEGDNRYHAILGHAGAAKYVCASSLGPALAAHGAVARVQGASGPRELPVAQLFRAAATDSDRPHALEPSEILCEIVVPPARAAATYEVRQREALDWPLAAAAVAFGLDGGRIRGARVVLGHVAPVPWVAEAAAAALEGAAPDEAAAARAGEAAVAGAKPLSGNAYKVQLARVAVKRAVLRAAGKEA